MASCEFRSTRPADRSEVAATLNPKTVTRWARAGNILAIRDPRVPGIGDPPVPGASRGRLRV